MVSSPLALRRARRRAGAFTLIELLVVIAIIAILAAILFPVFAQAREKARQTACLSNTKQMALGIQQYTQDYDELLPVIGDNAQCRGRWQWQIFSYVKNDKVFTCPNVPDNFWVSTPGTPAASTPPCDPTVKLGQSDHGGYGMSGALGNDNRDGSYPKSPGWSLADIKKPSETILIGDVSGEIVSGTTYTPGYYMSATNPALAAPFSGMSPFYYPQFRHNTSKTVKYQDTRFNVTRVFPIEGRANFTFLDGHAKSLDVGTAFKEAPKTGVDWYEDGVKLDPTAAPAEKSVYNSHYLLWNIY